MTTDDQPLVIRLLGYVFGLALFGLTGTLFVLFFSEDRLRRWGAAILEVLRRGSLAVLGGVLGSGSA